MTRQIKFRICDRVRVLRPSPHGGRHGYVESIDETARDPYLVRFDDGSCLTYAGDELAFDPIHTGMEFIDRVAELTKDPEIGKAFDDAIEARRKDSFVEYQHRTRETAIYPADQGVVYTALGLASEAGEVAGKVKKAIRDGINVRSAVIDELGDVLWYVARLADELGEPLSDVAERNLLKLGARAERGTLSGSGDER